MSAKVRRRSSSLQHGLHGGMPRTVDMTQGDKVSPVFTKEEFDTRLAKLRAYMDTEGLGAVVLTSYHNINYYSGFLYCKFARDYGLVVTADHSTLISSGVDGGMPWRQSLGTVESVAYTDWEKGSFFHCVTELVQGLPGRVGLEFDHVTADNKVKFDAAIPQATVDIGRHTMRLRMIKSQQEIALLRNGARIAEIGATAAVEALHEGVGEHEVALASTNAMIHEIARTYPDAELRDTWTWLQSGINTDGAHNWPTTRKVQKGDIMSLNCFPMIAGCYAALERTLFLDHASEDHLRIWEINVEVLERGIQLIRPGAVCSDIAKELNNIYREHDLLKYRTIGYGHSVGGSVCHYYGREAELELREDIHTVLQPGMAVSMEPMVMIPEGVPGAGGYREHDILIVTETGNENITKFPYGPKHNIIQA